MRLHPDNAEMFGQWQYHPVTKMLVERDQCSLLLAGAFENERIIGSRLANFGCPHDIVSMSAQKFRQLGAQTLIQVKLHGKSGRVESLNFRVQNGSAGVIQNRLNIHTRELRVAAQN